VLRTLILIPLMYSRADLKKILGSVPEDFEDLSSEFWGYVEEKLKIFEGKVQVVYSEKSIITQGESAENVIIGKLNEDKPEFHCVEDPLLAAEVEGWLDLMKNGQNKVVLELFEESLRERDQYTLGVIDRTLEDSKIGVLLIDPARRISFPDSIRVIRMYPFDPVDYLNRHLVKQKRE
jgi:hypothetical protein